MTCEEIRKTLPLLLYGELSFEDEERLEQHLDECSTCRAELERERALHRMLDRQELEPSPVLLRESRLRFEETMALERSRSGWLSTLNSYLRIPSFVRPVGALALIATGFFGARWTPLGNMVGLQTAGLFDPNTARVRFVEPGPGGQVQIVVDETRQRVLSGRLDDAKIRGLLLSAVKDPSDPGLRVETVELLKGDSGNDEIRTAMVYALQHDTNAGVRLKALEGLKPFASHPDVRRALSHALLSDDNPGIRTQAIDLLTAAAAPDEVREQQLVGVFQELMRHEDNDYIRLRCEKALHAMKASVETY
jgi:hypothetical protein